MNYTLYKIAKEGMLLSPKNGKPTKVYNTVLAIARVLKIEKEEDGKYAIPQEQIDEWNNAVRFVKGIV